MGVGNPQRWNLAAPIWIIFVLPVRGVVYLHWVKNRHLNLLPVIVLPVVENGDKQIFLARSSSISFTLRVIGFLDSPRKKLDSDH